ncbi:Protein POLLENLESS 3-LIKE 2 [Hibiscus syriacus]|uniref:Protein POLLENLESS 3-LIKE 2 n=1 Tax=Hibiscus syriacus TaxID=106335 RepID=A0A6A3B004_HIBSY|nr:Protein POLLENLESS 3-LIKE 2 [Hibiscus syriacus]
MMQDLWNAPPGFRPSKSAPTSPAKPLGVSRTRSESFHSIHKVPVGDTPYVRAKNVQLVDKDPERAIPLFWAAINAGDRVDSALKDMAIVMKQQNRAEEAIEAIKSLRSRCSDQAQESLDNILLDLYKRCGRLDDQVALLKHKLYLIQQGLAFNGKRTKTARSQGKKFQVSVEQEATRLLGNLGWALMQQNNYIEAEDAYLRALSIAPDNNKMCNLGICLMKQGRITEAKESLRRVKPAVADGPRGVDSHLKAYERAQQMLNDLESEMMNKSIGHIMILPMRTPIPIQCQTRWWRFLSRKCKTVAFNIDAPPFYSAKWVKEPITGNQMNETLKTRSGNSANYSKPRSAEIEKPEIKSRRLSPSSEEKGDDKLADLLPDSKDFEEAIIAAVLGPTNEPETAKVLPKKIDKRLKVFQDITLTLSLSPRA